MSEHRWSYCTHCRTEMVNCGYCGNNTCNGGSGDGCPDNCKSAREFEALSEVPPELVERRKLDWEKRAAMTEEQREADNAARFNEMFP